MDTDLIVASNLSKTYGKKHTAFRALQSVNLTIKAGETVAIIGKSGSGKSTLMHLLALLDQPSTGSIKINGQLTSKLSTYQLNHLRNREFGFVFQQFFMNASDNVLGNVLLPLKIAGTKHRLRKELALKALDTVGLKHKAMFKSTHLSGGEKQRVCIARAIVNRPQVLFADEPTGNLDSNTGQKIIQLLFDMNKKQRVTLIIVTHDEDLANLCQRQIRIQDGRIVSDSASQQESKK